MTDPQTKVFETKRLILGRLKPDDLESQDALYRDPAVTKYIPDAPQNYNETKGELELFMNGHPRHPELGIWATIHKESDQFVRRCGLLSWTMDGRQEVKVAYLVAKEYWGQDLGTEAAQSILEYGFEKLHYTRLICKIDTEKAASLKMAENIGMTFEKEGQDEMGPNQLYSIEKPSSQRQPGRSTIG